MRQLPYLGTVSWGVTEPLQIFLIPSAPCAYSSGPPMMLLREDEEADDGAKYDPADEDYKPTQYYDTYVLLA